MASETASSSNTSILANNSVANCNTSFPALEAYLRDLPHRETIINVLKKHFSDVFNLDVLEEQLQGMPTNNYLDSPMAMIVLVDSWYTK